jgi:hypothetical protein
MSDAQLPPDTGDEESAPPQRWGAHLNDAGVLVAVRLDASDDASPQDVPLPLPDAFEGEANGHALDVPVLSLDAPANEAASDDVQPMLDLRLPDASSTTTTPDEPLPLGSQPIDDPHEPLTVASQPVDDPHAAASSGEHHEQGQSDTAGDATPAADMPMEISPIFSALDAAERAAQAVPEDETAEEPLALDTDMLAPHAQREGSEETVAAAAELQALELPAIEVSEDDTIDTTIDTTPPSEASQQDATIPPDAEQEASPAEALDEDAAARIAAEANATAAALENLKRLLLHKLPQPHLADASNPQAGPELADPPPIPVYRPPIQLPVTPPPMIAAADDTTSLSYFEDEEAPPRRRWGMALGSFFAGFALSWVFGAVLYVYLTAG